MRNIIKHKKAFLGFFLGALFIIFAISKGSDLKTSKHIFQDTTKAGGSNWIAPKSADNLKNPLKGDAKAAKEGKALFTNYCVSCHGPQGEGNGIAAASLTPKPKNLTSEQVQKQTDGAIFWKITTGKLPMLSWKSTLTDKQRWSLVDYIRQLKKNK